MGRARVLLLVGVLAAVAAPGLVAQEPGIRLHDVAGEWGITFQHHTGRAGHRYMVETMVGGLVMLDFDGDGDEDLFFVDGGALPDYQGEAPHPQLFRVDTSACRLISLTPSRSIMRAMSLSKSALSVNIFIVIPSHVKVNHSRPPT